MSALHRTRGEAIEGKPRPVPPLGRPSAEEERAEDLSPADLLRVEHDLIRRVVRVLERESTRIGEERQTDPFLLSTVVDFIDTYAGRVHHEKEEEILFRELDDKDLPLEHRRIMEELVSDHVEMRHTVEELRQAKERYREGEPGAVDAIGEGLERLSQMYPGHMEREDKVFFPIAMDYLDAGEQQAMLNAMQGHDRAMIHEKYGSVAEDLEAVTEDWALGE